RDARGFPCGARVLAACPWRTAAAAMDSRIHRASPAGRRDGYPNPHPISLLDPRTHRTQPRQNRRRSAMNTRTHRTQPRGTGRRAAMDTRIHRTQPRGTGRRGAMDPRIHRTGRLIMEETGVIPHGHMAAVTWQRHTMPGCPGRHQRNPRRTRPPLYLRQALLGEWSGLEELKAVAERIGGVEPIMTVEFGIP